MPLFVEQFHYGRLDHNACIPDCERSDGPLRSVFFNGEKNMEKYTSPNGAWEVVRCLSGKSWKEGIFNLILNKNTEMSGGLDECLHIGWDVIGFNTFRF